jgi:Protein of unknown function (DUF2842)
MKALALIGDVISMPIRVRKIVGTLALLAMIAVYSLLVMGLVATAFPQLGTGMQLVFYAIAGLAWVPPAGKIINWMHKV